MGQLATLVQSCMNDSLPIKRTIEQITETIPLAPQTIQTATLLVKTMVATHVRKKKSDFSQKIICIHHNKMVVLNKIP